ncbi:MAG: cellulase N-terminal Ig-like domain-containing protein [Acidobacteriaceae bacterium]
MQSFIRPEIPLRENSTIETSCLRFLIYFSFALIASTCLAQMHIVVDQVGYETTAPKQALVVFDSNKDTQDAPHPFTLTDADTGKVVMTGVGLRNGCRARGKF